MEHLLLVRGEGLQIYLRRSKTDRANRGEVYRLPALAQLCPVQALERYLAVAGLTEGAYSDLSEHLFW